MERSPFGTQRLVRGVLSALSVSLVTGCATSTSVPAPVKPPAALASAVGLSPSAPTPKQKAERLVAEPLTRANAHHLLSRFTFGPTVRELESAEKTTAIDWLSWQLEPESIDDSGADARLGPYQAVLLPPDEVRARYSKTVVTKNPKQSVVERVDVRRLIVHAQMVQFVRQTISSRQLLEVMVDFWFNHFNVDASKTPADLLVTDYIERAIRPHALGRFEDLLIATAQHPAMLVYLDNYQSSVPKMPKPGSKRRTPTGGINENYARELLELHTLGVHGGYSQHDVVDVARILTGWTLADPRKKNYEFLFKPEMHDRGAKKVLGVDFTAGGGQEEGERLLEMLADNPNTARHVATRLCARFVADDPPADCVEEVAGVFMSTHGDIKAMLVSIVESSDFWRDENRLSKVKAPMHFMVSAYRALDTLPPKPGQVWTWGEKFGQPLLLQAAPTGYPLDGKAWRSSADALARMQFSAYLARQAYDDVVPGDVMNDAAFADYIQEAVLTGPVSPETRDVIETQLREASRSAQKRKLIVTLALGSPEFQYF